MLVYSFEIGPSCTELRGVSKFTLAMNNPVGMNTVCLAHMFPPRFGQLKILKSEPKASPSSRVLGRCCPSVSGRKSAIAPPMTDSVPIITSGSTWLYFPCNYDNRYIIVFYRVTIQVNSNLPLTSIQKFLFSTG